MIILIQQQLILLYYLIQHSLWTKNTKPIALLPMNKATARRCWRTPADAHTRSAQEDAKPITQDYEFRVTILFFSVSPFVLFDIRQSEDP